MSEPRKSRREPKLSQRFKEFLEDSTPTKPAPIPKAVKTPTKSESPAKKTVIAKTPVPKKGITTLKAAEKSAAKSSTNKNKVKPVEEESSEEDAEEEEISTKPVNKKSVKSTPKGKQKKEPVGVKKQSKVTTPDSEEEEEKEVVGKRQGKPSSKKAEAEENEQKDVGRTSRRQPKPSSKLLDSEESEVVTGRRQSKPTPKKIESDDPDGDAVVGKRQPKPTPKKLESEDPDGDAVVSKRQSKPTPKKMESDDPDGDAVVGKRQPKPTPKKLELEDSEQKEVVGKRQIKATAKKIESEIENDKEPVKVTTPSLRGRGGKRGRGRGRVISTVTTDKEDTESESKEESDADVEMKELEEETTEPSTPVKKSVSPDSPKKKVVASILQSESSKTNSVEGAVQQKVSVQSSPVKSPIRLVSSKMTSAIGKNVLSTALKTVSSPITKTNNSPSKREEAKTQASATVNTSDKVITKMTVSPLTKGVKRSSTEDLSEEIPAKKVKVGRGGTPLSSESPKSPPSIPIKLSKVTATREPSVSSPSGVSKVSVKTVTVTPKSSASLPPKANIQADVESGGEARRSRRQPKITERMKEFLHMETDEPESTGKSSGPPAKKTKLQSRSEEYSSEDFDDEDDMEDSSDFIAMMKSNATNISSPSAKKLSLVTTKSKSTLPIKTTQVVGKQPTLLKNTVSVKTVTKKMVTPGPTKVAIKKPTLINGGSDKISVMASKGTSRIITKKLIGSLSKSSAAPIIIKVRTLTSEDLDKKRKKEEEFNNTNKDRKIIKINTMKQRFIPTKKSEPQSSGESEDDSMDEEELEDEDMDSDGEEEEDFEEDMEEETMDFEKLEEKKLSSQQSVINCTSAFNKKMIYLCVTSLKLLLLRKQQFLKNELKMKIEGLKLKSVGKFVTLTNTIIKSVRTAIKEEGTSLSDSTSFDEYFMDVMDSISLSGNDTCELSHKEADDLLNFVRQVPFGNVKRAPMSNELMFLSNVLEMTSTGDRKDSSMEEDELFGDYEDGEEEEYFNDSMLDEEEEELDDDDNDNEEPVPPKKSFTLNSVGKPADKKDLTAKKTGAIVTASVKKNSR